MCLNFDNLKKSFKIKLVRSFVQLYLSGISINDVFTMSNSRLRRSLGFKYSSYGFSQLKENINQLYSMKEFNDKILEFVLPFFSMLGYRGKGLKRIKYELKKTIELNN